MLEIMDREEQMLVFAFVWILIGVFASYGKVKLAKGSTPTLRGIFDRLLVAVAAWGFVVAGMELSYIDFSTVSHSTIILPLIAYGYGMDLPIGGVIKQKIEDFLKSKKAMQGKQDE